MQRMYKLGLDLHGILNDNPMFRRMAKLFVADGNEVHIITGSQWKSKIEKELLDIGIKRDVHYTHSFSITDYLIEQGNAVTWQDPDNPWFDKEEWNKAKATYCRENEIDMHFDDTAEYGNHFSTPFFLKVKTQVPEVK